MEPPHMMEPGRRKAAEAGDAMDLGGRVVIVTGASSGIGRELARQLSAKGARLTLLARRAVELDACRGECRDPEEVLVAATDVTRPGQVSSAVATTFDRFGRIDVLVNAAGLGYFGPVETMKMADFDRMMKVNVYGLLYMTQAALPYLKESRGMLVNVSSALSKRALPFLSAYGGSKAMVDHLTDGLRMELTPYGVHVLGYNPPEVETDFAVNGLRDESLAPTRPRKGKPVAEVVRRIVAAMEAERRDVVEGRALAWMDLLAPRRTDAMFCRAMVEPWARERRTG
jgi:short-subunit dehydrogenase